MDEDTFDQLSRAFREVELELAPGQSVSDENVDAVLDPWDLHIPLNIKRASLVSVDAARRLVASAAETQHGRARHGPVPFVVANRITEEAREALLSNGWGYLDLRGELALRVPGTLLVRSTVEPMWSPRGRTDALSGKVGLEVAAALLMNPTRSPGIRDLARELGRSASTVSQIATNLRNDQLVEDDLRVSSDRLFWELAERWPNARSYLADVPRPGDRSGTTIPLRLGLENPERTVGWALGDTAAAAVLGAPVASRLDQPLDFFVPDEVTARRARSLLQVASSRTSARCSIRVAPVPAVCENRLEVSSNPWEWPVAHPLFVALDLAQDKGRGREILTDWTPSGGWARVW